MTRVQQDNTFLVICVVNN